jgi:hypothetical protein
LSAAIQTTLPAKTALAPIDLKVALATGSAMILSGRPASLDSTEEPPPEG